MIGNPLYVPTSDGEGSYNFIPRETKSGFWIAATPVCESGTGAKEIFTFEGRLYLRETNFKPFSLFSVQTMDISSVTLDHLLKERFLQPTTYSDYLPIFYDEPFGVIARIPKKNEWFYNVTLKGHDRIQLRNQEGKLAPQPKNTTFSMFPKPALTPT